jgi:hypothetical protein
MNDVMEEEYLQKCEIDPSFKIENNQNPENERKHKKITCSKNDLEIKW